MSVKEEQQGKGGTPAKSADEGTDKDPKRPSLGEALTTWLRAWLPDNRRFSNAVILSAVLWSIVVAVGILLYTEANHPKIGVALAATFAATAVGALGGFLFGVPMARSDGQRATKAKDGGFRPNTNLEQVSDWITKIIVGVGLIQFRAIGTAVYDIGRSVGTAIGAPESAPDSATAFGVALVVGSSVIAFLLCYMWTTTRLYDVFTIGNDGLSTDRQPEPDQSPDAVAAPERGSTPATG